MPVFQPPTVNDVPRVLPDTRGVPYLFARHCSNLPRGRSVIKIGGVYQTVDNPEQSTLDLATEVYLGGHIYTVTQTVADALTAAGYTVTADPSLPVRVLRWGFLQSLTWDDFTDQYGTWG